MVGWALVSVAGIACGASAPNTGFDAWTLVEDPPHPNFSATVDSPASVTLRASGGAIPAATDIGFQSMNGLTAGASTDGFAFDRGANFAVAVDFNASFDGPAVGGLAIGLGVGVDGNGSDGAGAGLFTNNGSALGFGGAARVNDVPATPQPLFFPPSLTGSLHAFYNASTGTVAVGVGAVGSATPIVSASFTNIAQGWQPGDLICSLFARSDASFGPAWTSGEADIVFSNFRVTLGEAVAIVSACSPADVTTDGSSSGAPDGIVSLSDFSYYLNQWSMGDPAADLTLDGQCVPGSGGDGVSLSDFSCFLDFWSQGCP